MPSRKMTEQDLIKALIRVNQDDNPNPDRRNCPNRTTLEYLAGAPADEVSIEESILLHLGNCWPCSQALKELRKNAKSRRI
jgi:hypothetical protein